MDPTLQSKIDEAKANGYTDEEISAYLGNQSTPAPQQGLGPMDRSEEYAGLAQGMGMNALGNAVEYGVPAAAAVYGVKKLIDAYKGPVSPAQAAQMGQAGQAAQNVGQAVRATGTGGAGAFNQMANQLGNNVIQMPKSTVPPTTPPQAPGMMQRGMDIANQMRQYAAQRVIPAGAAAGPAAVMGGVAAVPGAMMYDAYKNYQGQTPDQRKKSSMEALSGQGLGQAGIY
jgi:hypothetical protein